jgi:hypothetical protein
MFTIGHMAIAYLLGRGSGKLLRATPNIPLLLALSILPDADILVGASFHRGPTHSVITAIIVFLPALYFYRKKAVPYLLAFASHAVIADLIIGGEIMLFWPLSTEKISLPPPFPYISVYSPVNVVLEFSLFIIATIAMLKTKDMRTFFHEHASNLLLAIPVVTVLLPALVGFPLSVPPLLFIPHVFYLITFSIAVILGLLAIPRLLIKTQNEPETNGQIPTKPSN